MWLGCRAANCTAVIIQTNYGRAVPQLRQYRANPIWADPCYAWNRTATLRREWTDCNSFSSQTAVSYGSMGNQIHSVRNRQHRKYISESGPYVYSLYLQAEHWGYMYLRRAPNDFLYTWRRGNTSGGIQNTLKVCLNYIDKKPQSYTMLTLRKARSVPGGSMWRQMMLLAVWICKPLRVNHIPAFIVRFSALHGCQASMSTDRFLVENYIGFAQDAMWYKYTHWHHA